MNCHICKKHIHASLLEYPRIGGICEKCATTLVMGWIKQNVDDVKKILSGEAETLNDYQTFVRLNPSWVKEKLGLQEDICFGIQHKQDNALVIRNEELVARGLALVSRIEKDKYLKINDFGIEMVHIPGGSFLMGSQSEEAYDDEQPVHKVTLSSFQIGKYEVTQSQWKVVMGSNPSYFQKGDNYPVEEVSWDDVQLFIDKLNQQTGKHYRLPTEAEWEYAARGGTIGDCFGNIDDIAWHFGNSGDSTHAVGGKQPNAFGLYDMLGNVWEWCQDRYDAYTSSAQTNPTGPSSGSYRVNRGGCWYHYARDVRAPLRYYYTPDYRYYNLGFRLAMDG